MIVTCPSCATRHDFPNALRAPGDVKITCRTCGHKWIEIEGDTTLTLDYIPRHHQREYRDPPRHAETLVEQDDDVQRLVSRARQSKVMFEERRKARRRRIQGWAGFMVFLLLPFVGAAMFPEAVVSAAPATIKAYERLGLGVNIYGLEIRRIEQQHVIIDGKRVLSIKGDVVNVAGDVRKIPWLRFALHGAGKEVYSWTLDTAARPLRPGESTSFVTRIAEPPEAAQDLQIRFAHKDEIGSNSTP